MILDLKLEISFLSYTSNSVISTECKVGENAYVKALFYLSVNSILESESLDRQITGENFFSLLL